MAEAAPTVALPLLLDLDGDLATGVNGQAVDAWPDRSGNGSDFKQPEFNRPIKRTGVLAGHAVVDFNAAATDYLYCLPTFPSPVTAVTAVIVAAQDSATPGNPGLLSARGVIGGGYDYEENDTGGWYVTVSGGTATSWSESIIGGAVVNPGSAGDLKTSSTPFGTFAAATYSFGVDGLPATLHVNGTEEGSVPGITRPTVPMAKLLLGGRGFGGASGEFADIRVARVIMFAGRLTAADRSRVHAWISETYGIAVTDIAAPTVTEGPLVDRWTGTALVRQRTDRWTGAALVAQRTTPFGDG